MGLPTIVCGLFSTAQAQPVGLEGYQVLEVELCNQGDIETSRALENANPELEIWSDRVDVGFVEVRVSPEQAQLLAEVGFNYKIRVKDLQRLQSRIASPPYRWCFVADRATLEYPLDLA